MDRTISTPPVEQDRGIERRLVLEELGLLGEPTELRFEALDRITRTAAAMIGAPTSTVTIVTEHDQRFPAAFGLSGEHAERRSTPLEESYCRFVVEGGEPIVIPDARDHDLTRGNPAIHKGAVAYAGVPLVLDDGVAIGTLCVFDGAPRAWTDEQVAALTDLARWAVAELELERRVADLERAQQIREELVAMVSHDLRTPLTAILGASEMVVEMWDELGDERRTALVRMVHRQGLRMRRLVDDLHDLVRLEAGELRLEAEAWPLAHVVADATECVEFDVTVDVDESIAVLVDRGRLEQVLQNLLTNAGKYGAPPVEVTAAVEDDLVRVRVRDHGSGVAPTFAPLLFERFSRDDRDVQAGTPGTGLGLSIARGLVRAMGGDLRHEAPDEGRGSVFVIELRAA